MMTLRAIVGALRRRLMVATGFAPSGRALEPDEQALLDALGDDWMVFEVISLCRGLRSKSERQPIFDHVRAELETRRAAQATGQSEDGAAS
ncbi:MAG: hypothetical protein KGJ86_02580 [Chloroflexota bacterium]|nr:hypothetical protein [Chloroflexota bacterium]